MGQILALNAFSNPSRSDQLQIMKLMGFTKADAQRVLSEPLSEDEISTILAEVQKYMTIEDFARMSIRIGLFSSKELVNRQNLQRAQKGNVTKTKKKLQEALETVDELDEELSETKDRYENSLQVILAIIPTWYKQLISAILAQFRN